MSMSISLIAVFIPILLMGGIVGRLFREFAMTLSVAIMISLVGFADDDADDVRAAAQAEPHARSRGASIGATEWVFDGMLRGYDRTLGWALDHPRLVDADPAGDDRASISISISIIPKGFFPQQDTGRINGGIQADQSISFQLMRQKLRSSSTSCRRTRR